MTYASRNFLRTCLFAEKVNWRLLLKWKAYLWSHKPCTVSARRAEAFTSLRASVYRSWSLSAESWIPLWFLPLPFTAKLSVQRWMTGGKPGDSSKRRDGLKRTMAERHGRPNYSIIACLPTTMPPIPTANSDIQASQVLIATVKQHLIVVEPAKHLWENNTGYDNRNRMDG